MKIFKSILFLLLFCQLTLSAQSPMQSGFEMLENGQFSEATVFFKNYLETDSLNQTALLCYGRGLGLSGQVDASKGVFENLQNRFPGNYEIDLNMAEAYMWEKDFNTALKLYQDLVERDSTNFGAILGYSNALSESKKYDKSLLYINKALRIQPGNGNALISRKYMRLGKAAKLRNKGKYESSIRLFNIILEEDKNDTDALINKAQTLVMMKNYKEARVVYEKLGKIKDFKSNGLLGLSTVANSQKKPKEALEFAKSAVLNANKEEHLKTNLGLVNAYGWNNNFVEAFQLLAKLDNKYPNNNDVLSAYGRINIWSKNFTKGAAFYKKLLEKQPSSFDGNLGFADAHFARGLDDVAYTYARKALEYYPEQRDVMSFIERLNVAHDPSISTHNFNSKDNGGNTSSNFQIAATIDPTHRMRTTFGYSNRKAENTNIDIIGEESLSQIYGGVDYRISGVLKLGGKISFATGSETQILSQLSSEIRIGRFQTLELKYYNEIQSFTAELLRRNLRMNNFVANYNLSLKSKVGFYSQLIHTQISDGNTRNLLFASLYYDFIQAPVLKAGLNFSVFKFKESVPEVYFSPDVFKSYELFIAAQNINQVDAHWLYQASIAGGSQQISEESYQSIYRVDVRTGWKFSQRFKFMVYYMKSNSAASSVQGFTYDQWGLNCKLIINTRKKK